jgi:cytochrome c6
VEATTRLRILLRKLLSILLLAIALFTVTLGCPALASEPSNGAKIFSDNCAACHVGGINVILGEKTLRKEALERYLENFDTDSLQAIISQVQNGKNAMPAFKDRLTEEEISDVAAYVLQKAQEGW